MPAGGPVNVARSNQVTQAKAITDAAAKKYGLPNWVLWGVYGVETGFGSNVNTSSTGAKGSFQFEPATAAKYQYPYTNATDTTTFTAQADGAAHYLSDLYNQLGHSWTNALGGYYAGPGGYNSSAAQGYATKVQNAGGTSGINPPNIPVVGPVIQATGTVGTRRRQHRHPHHVHRLLAPPRRRRRRHRPALPRTSRDDRPELERRPAGAAHQNPVYSRLMLHEAITLARELLAAIRELTAAIREDVHARR